MAGRSASEDATATRSRVTIALGRIVLGTVQFDRGQFQLLRGIRYALGVGIPLFVGIATGYTIEGIAISGGATMIGLTDSGVPYRGRVRAMVIASVAAAVSTFVGEISG